MLIVQASSGLYYAVQYDGTNGAEIVSALHGTDSSTTAGVLSFRSFIMRAGGLLNSGHRFRVPIGYWIVWVDDVNPYVVGGPLTPAEFEDQYQVCDCSATSGAILALQVAMAALQASLAATDISLAATQASLTATQVSLAATQASLTLTQTSLVGTQTDVTTLQTNVTTIQNTLLNFPAGNITTGTLPYQRLGGTIAEADTVAFNRATLVNPGTAADAWQFRYNGTRTLYANEYNLLRVRGVPDDQVVARFMSNFARDGGVTAILQASLSNASSHLFQVLGNGDILSTGGLSMLPTAPVAVTFNGAAGTANAALISDGAATGAPYPVTTTLQASDNRVYLDGAVANPTGVAIAGGVVLFTVTAAHRPTAWTQRAARTSTVLQARVTIKPNGEVVADQALAPLATLSFDGMNWRKA